MHMHTLEPWQHRHLFLGAGHDRYERRTWIVVGLTAAMMLAEIVGGTIYGSMAVVADGWHMATHAGALMIAALAYGFARRYAHDPRFSFGTGKLGDLAAFSSAVILALIALFIGYESFVRIISPIAIDFDQATLIAALGLAVNLLTAWLLRDDGHHHAHDHDVHHAHQHRDHNLRAAYVHVLADALTSVLAIAALLTGRFLGWVWMDPLMGIVGAGFIAVWSIGLLRSAGAVLLDTVPDPQLASVIRERLETGDDRVADLHLWRVGPGHTAVVAVIVAHAPHSPDAYKTRLNGIAGLSHITIEVHQCPDRGYEKLHVHC